ncbi:hypothetical protein [Deinococcus planocerae]|uniref:hypothetical protein n=1 Tax=Deinococcus planocerae TaxID=1737569 RepID=UPI000C7F4082|nr:hypothetical protein [Deinococcus planocerae]
MLLLNSPRSIVVDGLTVFPDHADENQFWVLPGPVQLGRRRADGRASFTFIKFKPAAVQAGVKGGGFLMFEVGMPLDDRAQRRILSRLRSLAPDPRLSLVQFDKGTVRCISLDLEGAGGTTTNTPPGAFRATEQILGATTPSLQGDNTAAFSLTLSQEGAIILEQAFHKGTTPVGVLYDLTFTGMRPALDVEITADLERVYRQFSADLSGQIYWFKASIEAGFEKLVQDQAIVIKVINATTDGDREQKEKWALDFFKDHLLTQWFTPTLTPGTLAGSTPRPNPTGGTTQPGTGGTTPPTGGGTTNPPGTNSPTTNPPTTTNPPGGGTTTPTPPTGPTNPPSTGTTSPASATATAVRQTATLTMTGSDPSPAPDGFRIEHTPSASGNMETLRLVGGDPNFAPTLKVDGVEVPVAADRTAGVEVAPGASRELEVTHAPVSAIEWLRFKYDEPVEGGWSAADPPTGAFARYVEGTPSDPQDSCFTGSKADFLAFLGRLAEPKTVRLEGQASYEVKARNTAQETAYTALNQRLSQRRLDVGLALARKRGVQIDPTSRASGHSNSEALFKDGDPGNDPGTNRDECNDFRTVMASGTTQRRTVLRATLARAADAVDPGPGPQPNPNPNPQPNPNPTPDPQPNPNPNPSPDGGTGNFAVALKLKFISQTERRTIKFKYTRSDAVQRTYAPQGFIGLLLDQLQDKHTYFLEVDLDDPFFRVFTVTVEAPLDFERIGLKSAQVALDYGDPADPTNHRHTDLVFDREHQGAQTFQVFMNRTRDTAYRYSVQYHFDPQSAWAGQRFSYDLPARRTEDRTLFLNPYEDLGFLEVDVVPGRIDWGVVRSVDVGLQYADAGQGFTHETHLVFTQATPAQKWALRLSDPNQREITSTLTFHLEDGTTRTLPPQTTKATAVPIDDPFEGALDLLFFPAFDPATTRAAFVDVVYDDPANRYHREERLRLEGEDRKEATLRLALLDPKRRAYSYRLTLVGMDGSVNQGPLQTTEASIVSVG